MYLVSFFAIFTLFASTIALEFHALRNKDRVKQNVMGDYNQRLVNQVVVTQGTGYSKDLTSTIYKGGAVSLKSAHVDKEIVTKVLLRTCSHLYAKALASGCANPREPATVWSFAGVVNATGNLSPAWTGATTNVFSCGNINSYGRDLIQKAIPSTFIASGGYRYDFTGMTGVGRTDPCGYTEIVDLP